MDICKEKWYQWERERERRNVTKLDWVLKIVYFKLYPMKKEKELSWD